MLVCVATSTIARLSHDVPLQVHEQRSHYTISANTLDELSRGLRVPGLSDAEGLHASGLTSTLLNLTREIEHKSGQCRVVSMRLELPIDIITPQWSTQAPLPDNLFAAWHQVSALIESHERAHRDNALDAAHWLREQLLDVGGWQNCSRLRVRLSRLLSVAEARRDLQDSVLDLQASEHRDLQKSLGHFGFDNRSRLDWVPQEAQRRRGLRRR